MKDRATILNLLNEFSNEHENISWKMKCTYADGMGTSINEINIIAQPGNRNIGIITYRIETGMVMICSYKKLKKTSSENIVDMLLDLINYSKV
ncbi:MAG: hypothetical protein HRT57_00365 [Crocinitomicaceae bacterium]|nr:hypothetical protein [Crocinitomicaceae bacterium]